LTPEVQCRRCGMSYVVDAASAGTSLPCPSCGAPDALAVPAAPRRSAIVDAPAPGKPGHPTARSRPVGPAPARPAAPPPRPRVAAARVSEPPPATVDRSAEQEEVVCPRCKLHFIPRRTAGDLTEGGRPVVLVVEDLDYFRQVAAEALGSRFEVRQASSVDEAREHLAAGGIDLLLLDPTLDGGDHGIGLLRSLPGKPFPILICSDQDESSMYDTWEEWQRLGADDIVMKGMNVGETLVRKVSGLLALPWDEDE